MSQYIKSAAEVSVGDVLTTKIAQGETLAYVVVNKRNNSPNDNNLMLHEAYRSKHEKNAVSGSVWSVGVFNVERIGNIPCTPFEEARLKRGKLEDFDGWVYSDIHYKDRVISSK